MSTQTTPKFCKDCAYFKSQPAKFQTCTAPVEANLNVVHGIYCGNCEAMREVRGACGPEAKLFEPATEPYNKITADRPVIIYAPIGSGKTSLAHLLANHFGKREVFDGWSPNKLSILPQNALALTNIPNICGALPLAEVLIQMGENLLRLSPAEASRRRADRCSPEDHQSPEQSQPAQEPHDD